MELNRGVMGTIKQSLSFTSLSECELGKMKAETKKSSMFEMIDQNETLKAQVKDLTIKLAKKNVELIMLNAQLAKGSRRGPDSSEVIELREVNV